MKYFSSVTLFLSVALLLTYGCATLPKEGDMKEALKTKAEEYWNLRLQDKYEETYKMEDDVGLPSFEEYQTRARLIRNFDITSHSIGEIEVEGAEATMDVNIAFRMPKSGAAIFRDAVRDKWVFKGGKWLHMFPKFVSVPDKFRNKDSK